MRLQYLFDIRIIKWKRRGFMEGQGTGKPITKRAKYEWVIIILLVISAVVIGAGIYRAQDKAQKGELMVSELEQLRAVIQLYKLLQKDNPADLLSLTKMTYTFAPGEQPKAYLSNIKVGSDGRLVDPFGSAYSYDAKVGWVHSATVGYEKW